MPDVDQIKTAVGPDGHLAGRAPPLPQGQQAWPVGNLGVAAWSRHPPPRSSNALLHQDAGAVSISSGSPPLSSPKNGHPGTNEEFVPEWPFAVELFAS